MVVNIRMDDADSGLMVRENPGLQSLGRPIPANATGVGITGACNTDTPEAWCEVQCKSRSLDGWSRARYLRPRSDTLYMMSATMPGDDGGLVMRTGPSETRHRGRGLSAAVARQ